MNNKERNLKKISNHIFATINVIEYNILESPQSNIMEQLVKEMKNVITHYSATSPSNRMGMEMPMIRPNCFFKNYNLRKTLFPKGEWNYRQMKLEPCKGTKKILNQS